MADAVHIDVLSRLKQAAEAKIAADPALMRALIGGGALLGGGALGAGIMHARDKAEEARAKNTSFGAGVATGMAGPRIVDALHAVMHQGDM